MKYEELKSLANKHGLEVVENSSGTSLYLSGYKPIDGSLECVSRKCISTALILVDELVRRGLITEKE